MATTELVEHDSMDMAGEVLSQGGAMQQIKTPYSTAVSVQRPRKLVDVERRLLEEARMAGETFYYGWGAGKDKIEGKTVKLAMAAARCFGNCATDMLPIQETKETWYFTAAFIDLETGFTTTRQFRQSKSSMVYGKHDPERKMEMRFQIGQSKSIRNVILNAVPEWMTDKAVEMAKQGVREKLEKYIAANGIEAARKLVTDSLVKCGVNIEFLLAKYGVPEITALDIEHLVMLRGDLSAIQSGQERASVLFPDPASEGENGPKNVKASPLNDQPAQANGSKAPEPKAEPQKSTEPPASKLTLNESWLADFSGTLDSLTEADDVTRSRDHNLQHCKTDADRAEINRLSDRRLEQLKSKRGQRSNKQGTLMSDSDQSA